MGDDFDLEEFDVEKLLVVNKCFKVVVDKSNGFMCEISVDDESDFLFDEIVQFFIDMEKIVLKVFEKFVKIVNLRWFNKFDEINLKEKVDKYF